MREIMHLNGSLPTGESGRADRGADRARVYARAQMSSKHAPLRLFVLLLAVVAGAAMASSGPAARDQREALASQWVEQGLQPIRSSKIELLYARPGARERIGHAMELAPVLVELRPDWQRASRELEHARLRPAEVQRLKEEVATVVADELRQQLAGVRGHAGGNTPVLQARVLDLYLNAPELQTAGVTRTYTRSFGDMILVAELREHSGGKLLFGAWSHRPAREFTTLRLTTRVENAIEVRAVARGWARELRRQLDRLDAGG
ncbi:MAG: hypothetical protein ABI588_01355 [Arenimonas sp.]